MANVYSGDDSHESLDTLIGSIINGSIIQESRDTLSPEVLLKVNTAIMNKLGELIKAKMDDNAIHLTMLLVRLFETSTSKKVTFSKDGSIKYKMSKDQTECQVNDVDIFPYIANLPELRGEVNPLRKWARSNEPLFIAYAKTKPDLFENHRATKHALPKNKGYLGADFLTGSIHGYSEEDRAIMRRAQEVALDKDLSGDSSSLISLQDLGNQKFLIR
nr:MAG: major coat protein [Plant associated crinivirus 1]